MGGSERGGDEEEERGIGGVKGGGRKRVRNGGRGRAGERAVWKGKERRKQIEDRIYANQFKSQ